MHLRTKPDPRSILVLVLISSLMTMTVDIGSHALDHDLYGLAPWSSIETDITINTTFTISESPIYINNTISVQPGVRLTIGPGCRLIFGKDAGLEIHGELLVGGDGPIVEMVGNSSDIKGYWKGLVFKNGSKGRIEGTSIIGSETAMNLTSTDDVVVRNSTITLENRTIELQLSASIEVYNSSLNYNNISILDNTSILRTFHFLGGIIVDHLGRAVPNVRVELKRPEGGLLMSHITNSTGEFPELLLEGRSFIKGGRSDENGRYNISVSDDMSTRFVNETISFNGTGSSRRSIRFTWPPELTDVPASFNVVEDRYAYHYCSILDRNQAGYVEVSASTDNVTYNRTVERLEFLYRDGSLPYEIVIISLDDGFDTREYMINVSITALNDPPEVSFQGGFIYPREDEPAYYYIDINDEDTPIEEIQVTTDDPENVSYEMENGRLVFLYGDGTPLEFSVNITVSDGNSSVKKRVFIYFQPVFYPPIMDQPLPEMITDEDTDLIVDLGGYISDPDTGEVLVLTARTDDIDLFSVTVDGFVLTIVPYPEANGVGEVQLRVSDERGLSTILFANVTILSIDDEPVLLDPTFESGDPGIFWFNITFGDVDGDMPDDMTVRIGPGEYDMVFDPIPLPDPTSGVEFHYRAELGPGQYNIEFKAVQGVHEVDLEFGDVIVPEVERSYSLSGMNGSLRGTLWALGPVGDPSFIEDDIAPDPADGAFLLGRSFSIESENITPVRAWITFWPLDIRSDILPLTLSILYWDGQSWTDMGSGIFNANTGSVSFPLTGIPLNSTISFQVKLDPEFDSDGDGVKNLIDAFPNDPSEWSDNDLDGIGDNADPDDDNDGFEDDIEVLADSDPLSDSSIPLDTDGDGIYNNMDLDDDGDGMPDEWEKENGLDPLDASDIDEDPDGDGIPNYSEYLKGTHPLDDDRVDDPSSEFPMWIMYAGILIVVLLVILGIVLFFLSRSSHREELEEAEGEWEIQGELDPDDAIDCPECGSIYPLWFEECPRCGEINPYEE